MTTSEIGNLLTRTGIGGQYSYRDAARLTGLSHATIERLHKSAHVSADGSMRAPHPATIDALSRLPGLTLSELRWAILVDLGYLTDYAEQQVRDHLGESSKRRVLTLEELAQELAKLPSQQREEVYAMVEDILGSV